MMHLLLKRYLASPLVVKGVLSIDGKPFCETREAVGRAPGFTTFNRLAEGTYPCRWFASELSPLSLKVHRSKGHAQAMLSYDAFRQVQGANICLGRADASVPAEERELECQEETFAEFTRLLYARYGEEVVLQVEDVER